MFPHYIFEVNQVINDNQSICKYCFSPLNTKMFCGEMWILSQILRNISISINRDWKKITSVHVSEIQCSWKVQLVIIRTLKSFSYFRKRFSNYSSDFRWFCRDILWLTQYCALSTCSPACILWCEYLKKANNFPATTKIPVSKINEFSWFIDFQALNNLCRAWNLFILLWKISCLYTTSYRKAHTSNLRVCKVYQTAEAHDDDDAESETESESCIRVFLFIYIYIF